MGGVARAELAAAVSQAGGFGCLGMVRESAQFIYEQIWHTRELTHRPFGVNLIPAATDPALLQQQLRTCISERVETVVLFWDVDAATVRMLKSADIKVLHQVGTVKAAIEAANAGADAIIAQGYEAGGHVHGTTSTLALVPAVVDAVDVPVIASGGIADGRGVVAAMALGAQGVHCGTAFLATQESFAHEDHKQHVVRSHGEDTLYGELFHINWPPQSPTRVLRTPFTEQDHPCEYPGGVVAYQDGRPIALYSTDSPLRNTEGDRSSMPFFAGQSSGLVTTIPPAAERLMQLVDETQKTLCALTPPSLALAPNTGESFTMKHEKLLELLNELLQGERAGAMVTQSYREQARDQELRTLMAGISADERNFALMLCEHIERLEGTPTETVGAFYDKAMKFGANDGGVRFLNKGQQWVVNILTSLLPEIKDKALLEDLTTMLKAHENNIRTCNDYLYARCRAADQHKPTQSVVQL